MSRIENYPRTVAARIVQELERRGVVTFGAKFQEAEALVTDIILQEICTPSLKELIDAAKRST